MSDQPQRMLGDPDRKEQLARIIRVDQAGEYGAVRIYQGQRAVLRRNAALKHMEEQEREHLARFNQLAAQHRVRPTLLQPLWHLAGFALGAGTALLGEKAAMACTVAVEDVIEEHYARQETVLDDQPELKATVQQFRAEEVEHRNSAIAQGAEQAAAYPVLYSAISAGTKFAIWLSERI
ncbi:MAG: demethoxyubiquinone hydroxylase family protein [Burkholderiales bacterium]|nr:demethoxyubiquinone hydroxylase family protein [Burkholderiales bacterium]